jgi:hypothetical protein
MGPHGNRMNTTGETTVSAQDDSDEQQEVIEVQILPQVNIILKDIILWSFSKVSLLGVDSLWGYCTFIPADWGS